VVARKEVGNDKRIGGERERQRGSFFVGEPNLACHPVGTILSKAQRR